MLLHHQLEVAAVFKHLQHLMEHCVLHMQHNAFGHGVSERLEPVLTLTMLWCCIRVRMAISWLTRPSMGSSTQDSLTILALLMNFTTTCKF